MNKQIMEWSSQQVYEGELKAHSSVENHVIIGESPIILLFIDTSGAKMGETLHTNAAEEGVSVSSSSSKNKSKSN
jgi:superfamily I DNA and/or RNA helicase